MRKYILTICMLLFCVQMAQSQVLITLLFGDKLNSDKIKFGLEGGMNFANVSNLETATTNTFFNIGFYFDFKIKDSPNWYLHSGVIVKSTMGAKLAPYSLEDEALDALFLNGEVDRRLQYWNIPFLARYKFNNNIFIEAGPMIGVFYKGTDIFTNQVDGNDLQYDNKIKKQNSLLDMGLEGGIGYHAENVLHGLNFGVRYYHGLLNTSKIENANQKNTSYYIYVGLPVGAGERAQAKKKAAAEKKAIKAAEKVAKRIDKGKKGKKKSNKN